MQIFTDIRRAYTKAEELTEAEMVDLYVRPRLLVIDEIQERGGSDWEDRLLTHIIDRRYGQMKDTILIGNLTREEFECAMGASVCDRLTETGGMIVCNWPTFRVAKMEATAQQGDSEGSGRC